MDITYRRVRLDDESEMREIAAIDATIPALFDSKFKTDQEAVDRWYQQLMKIISPLLFMGRICRCSRLMKI